jgi:hypothetical protein
LVAGSVLVAEIIEQAPPLPNHDEQASPRMEILLVRLQMFGQIADALAQQGHLDFGRTRVIRDRRVLLDDRLLALALR